MQRNILKKGEIAATLLIGVVASGVAINYGAKEIVGPNVGKFIKEWVIHPAEVGACAPCSKYVAKQMVRFLETKQERPLRVLEVGAGTGTFTREIACYLKGKNFEFDVIEKKYPYSIKSMQKKSL